MENEKRPLILLYRDKRMERSFKTVAKLCQKGKLDSVEWVLIPILHTSATYIAVSGEIIATHLRAFHSALIRYHMQYCNDCGVGNDPEEDRVEIVWDYETITIQVSSIEELYNALYQPVVFEYLRSLRPFSDRGEDFWFIHVRDFEVISFDGTGKKIDSFCSSAEVHVGSVPFPYDDGALVVDELASHFGLIHPNEPRFRGNLVFFKEDKTGRICWKEVKGNIQMYSSVKGIGIGSGAYCSFVVLSDKDYCAALRINTASIYVAPFEVAAQTYQDVLKYLVLTTQYGVPKYVFGQFYETDYEMKVEPIYHDYGMQVTNVENIDLFDSDDVCIFIEHIYYLLQLMREGCRVHIASNLNSDSLQPFELSGAVLLECHLELNTLGEPEMDDHYRDFSLYTDAWQDNLPNIREVCYLIQLAEKEK